MSETYGMYVDQLDNVQRECEAGWRRVLSSAASDPDLPDEEFIELLAWSSFVR